MGWKSTTAFIALSLFGAGSLVYLLFHKDEEFDDFFLLRSSKTSVVEVKIPKESVGVVIGRRRNKLNEIESKSNALIQIKDDDLSENFRICVIRGTPEATQFAEFLIHEVIVRQSLIETFEMCIPIQACGRIIGKGGSNVTMISRSSNAKLTLLNPQSSESFERKLVIKGTAEEIALARILVEQKLEEEREFRKMLQVQMSNRPPRNQLKYLLPAAEDEQGSKNSSKHKEKFMPTGSNGLLEVYVSAIESPDRLWLQMMGPSAVDLDRLIEQMTDYYSKDENKDLHKLREVKCGQIVAAPFTFDDKWYRAEVLEIQNDSDTENSNVLLYYVDYGDTCLCKETGVYELRTDFLRLRFQAIECMLAKIKPTESTWTDEAIELLGDLTHVALWKSLVAKIHTYKERPTRAKREGSPIPCVELYDSHGEKMINVAEELVEKGFAAWEEISAFSRIDSSPNATA